MRRDPGFTLMELLVVLAILGLGLAIVAPLLGKRAPGAALAAGAGEIGAALRAARNASISEGRPVAFRGDPAGGYWLDRRHYPLAAGELRVATVGGSQISFFPSGGSSGGRIFLESPGGRREIAVDAITGRIDARR